MGVYPIGGWRGGGGWPIIRGIAPQRTEDSMKRIASLLALVAAVAAVAVPAASADKVKSAVSWHSVAPASTDGARW